MSQFKYKTPAITSEITYAAEKIDIETAITKFSDIISDKLNDHIHQTSICGNSCDDVEMLEAANEVLSSAWSDIICSAVQSRIELSVMVNARMKEIVDLYSSVKFRDIDQELRTRRSTQNKHLDASNRLIEMCNNITSYHRMRSITVAEIMSVDNLHIRKHPRRCAELLACEHYACQLKRGRALLRLDRNHPTRQMNQCEYVELDSWHLFSCIEQASESENVSQLAKVLEECESILRSSDKFSTYREIFSMMSPVSRDACKFFLSTRSSVEGRCLPPTRRGKNQ